MAQKIKSYWPALLSVLALAFAFIALIPRYEPTAQAATPVSGAQTAKAGTGGVTVKTFVRLEAAGVIYPATAVSHTIVGVCEQTAAAGALTKYAPPGTISTVTSGDAIAVGDRLTATTGGKAIPINLVDTVTEQMGAVALTAATGADEDVTVYVTLGTVQAPSDLPDVTVDTLTVDDDTTPSVALATGKTNTGYIDLAGKTSGKLRITAADATAQTVTFAPAAQTSGAGSASIPDLAGGTCVFNLLSLAQTITGVKTHDAAVNLGVGASTAADGSTTADAGALPAGTDPVYPTTAADGTKGVVINAADKVTGRVLFIGNGVSNKILKIYAPSGGNINGLGADAAFSSVSGKGAIIVCLNSGANTWFGW